MKRTGCFSYTRSRIFSARRHRLVVADGDEYPPTVEAMELLYVSSASATKRLVHYAAVQEAPWTWFEIFDLGKVPDSGSHGTDLFKTHPELADIVVDFLRRYNLLTTSDGNTEKWVHEQTAPNGVIRPARKSLVALKASMVESHAHWNFGHYAELVAGCEAAGIPKRAAVQHQKEETL